MFVVELGVLVLCVDPAHDMERSVGNGGETRMGVNLSENTGAEFAHI